MDRHTQVDLKNKNKKGIRWFAQSLRIENFFGFFYFRFKVNSIKILLFLGYNMSAN